MQNVKVIEEHQVGLLSKIDKILKITSDQCVEMKKNNIIAPFGFKKGLADYFFRLNYATLDDALGPICQIHRASTLPPAEQAAMISVIVLSRRSRVKFNTSWLEDLYENILLETQADRITPLATNPGRIMLTSSRLYFQPFNNIDRWPVLKIRIKDIRQIILRRFLLRQLGVEIECCDTAPVTHLYLAMKTEADRNEFYEKITHLEELQLEERRQEDMTLRWQSGITSNYDYLLYLNSMADRSFNDLTQYPVMPWVVQDYHSSQLDLDDESTFRDLTNKLSVRGSEDLFVCIFCVNQERLPDLPEPKFLYGSHYSNPGYVLFFLARIAPEYVLCLQNGRFDHPDRMFNSIQDTWTNCLTGASDFKELIPEFYAGSGEFLVHNGVINFGFRNDGRPVGDVSLPPWASDPKDFICKLQEALESDYVSRHLHLWIDLIFGYKQHGEAAMEADNVFHYLTYEGSVDLQRIKDLNERACLETQIMEFGQTPKQLFTSPHPQRLTSGPIPRPLVAHSVSLHIKPEVQVVSNVHLEGGDAPSLMQTNLSVDVADKQDDKEEGTAVNFKNFDSLTPQLEYTLHKNIVTAVHMSADEKNIFSVSHDGLLKMYSLEEQRQLRSVNLSSMPLSSCVVMPDNKTIIAGSWDNNVIEYGSVQETLQAHDDAVSCIMWMERVLYTASWDGTVKMWQLEEEQDSVTHSEYLGQLDHEDGVLCMDTQASCRRLVTGSRDGHLALWDLDHCYLVSSISLHDGPINACYMCLESRRIVTCGADRLLKVTDMDTMTEMFAKDLTHPVLCIGALGSLLVTGNAAGLLQVWDMDVGQVVAQLEAHKGGITSIDTRGVLLSGGEDRCIRLWKPGP
ncbi:hypothetical protein C0Q70_18530 [Pomacea canaliculata]|uniref:BEACH domain-containing protein n=1 Tax=Pomacea canaliculata TaxID=400727 RepID=A0A2T7NGU6_POMCA|nr:hypothetical protein C0Q70_18530 [Pomacea canaliculata]